MFSTSSDPRRKANRQQLRYSRFPGGRRTHLPLLRQCRTVSSGAKAGTDWTFCTCNRIRNPHVSSVSFPSLEFSACTIRTLRFHHYGRKLHRPHMRARHNMPRCAICSRRPALTKRTIHSHASRTKKSRFTIAHEPFKAFRMSLFREPLPFCRCARNFAASFSSACLSFIDLILMLLNRAKTCATSMSGTNASLTPQALKTSR